MKKVDKVLNAIWKLKLVFSTFHTTDVKSIELEEGTYEEFIHQLKISNNTSIVSQSINFDDGELKLFGILIKKGEK